MRTQAIAASTFPSRRARTLAAALSVLFVGTAIYARNVRAEVAAGLAADQPQTSHPRDSVGFPTLDISALAYATGDSPARASRTAAMPIAWTSPWGRDARPQQIPTR
ncbi:MAG TPA: hypothetical protein VM073_01380 [Usitatibacter sp.]|nr:hypothetical protein [Usitatibacter sp.]